ncbi:hypothetical protein ACH51_22740 (plasmid) [Ralstonia solanacearum]|nr:hypothetical protein ACH51_22740 [Ralstonia solanacearum]
MIQLGDDVTAAQVLAQLKQGGDFAKLAQQYSTAPNKVRGGDMDWVSFKVPISDAEHAYLRDHGLDALERAFEDRQIDIFDINRDSVF